MKKFIGSEHNYNFYSVTQEKISFHQSNENLGRDLKSDQNLKIAFKCLLICNKVTFDAQKRLQYSNVYEKLFLKMCKNFGLQLIFNKKAKESNQDVVYIKDSETKKVSKHKVLQRFRQTPQR